MKDAIGVVESAWRVDLEIVPWLTGILEAAREGLDDGHGMWAAPYDATSGKDIHYLAIAGVGMKQSQLDAIRDVMPMIPWEAVEQTFLTRSIGTLSQLLGRAFLEEHPLARASAKHLGIHDALGINAQDVTGVGCVLGVPLKRRQRATREWTQRWSRLSAHVASAFRLRRQLTAATDAIIEPGGLVAHAEGEARDVAVRTALRAAAVTIDRARTQKARSNDATECLEQWRAMVDGRWSLVDHFDRDGRRYYVARRNEPQLDDGALTPRERQIAGFAALGHSNKLIGYELGVSTSTVATHLSSAARKLGCKTRVELIAAMLAKKAPAP